MDEKLERVIAAGRDAGIDVSPTTFSAGTRTAGDAAREVGCDISQIVKSLVFGSERGPILFLVSGANRLDATKGAAAAGVSGLDRADADAAKRATGYSIGATPPLGLATDLGVFMDEDLLVHDVVWAAAGRPDSVFPADPKELARAAGAEIAELKEG